jgi:hypothetical protein
MTIRFAEYGKKIEQHLAREYGISVLTLDIQDPLIGDLDGKEILIDHAVTPELRLFLLVHLFGHTAQWNLHPNGVELGRARQPIVPAAEIPALVAYEMEAASYALGMLHSIAIAELDQWLSDYTTCDTAYLHHYYSTGEKREFQTFWRTGVPCIQPRSVPPFRAQQRARRSGGIVI